MLCQSPSRRHAAGAAARERCSEATLRGTYLFAYVGVGISGNDQVPFAYAGYQVHDGRRKMNGVFSGNYNGKIFSIEPFAGTYTVNADCTGTVTTEGGTHYDLFIAPDGSMFTFVQTDSEYVTSGTAQRIRR
jgi:hypothetical protein